MKVIIAGQKYFGEQVLRMCLLKNIEVVAVSCPVGDEHIGKLASINNIRIIPAGSLSGDTCPTCDLGIAAHSFDFIGRRTRYAPKMGWVGYHPSLLPRHRGRSSIEWAVRMGDAITGGTVYWLNSGVDRGDIAAQDWCFIDKKMQTLSPSEAARVIWREQLCDMGVKLLSKVVCDIASGKVIRKKQNERFATFEPSISGQRLYRPDLLMIEMVSSTNEQLGEIWASVGESGENAVGV